MAWTTPRDWTGIADNIVTAEMLNVDVRDNFSVLSTHQHTGSAGQGGASMSGLTLTAIGVMTFADQSADPDAAGELQRNGNNLLWYGASVVNLTQSDASAGTASLRSLGTTALKAAAGDHAHALTAVATSGAGSGQGTTPALSNLDCQVTFAHDAGTQTLQSYSPTFSSSTTVGRIVVGTAAIMASAAISVNLQVLVNSVGLETSTIALAAPDSGDYQPHNAGAEAVQATATSGQVVKLDLAVASGTGTIIVLASNLSNHFISA